MRMRVQRTRAPRWTTCESNDEQADRSQSRRIRGAWITSFRLCAATSADVGWLPLLDTVVRENAPTSSRWPGRRCLSVFANLAGRLDRLDGDHLHAVLLGDI